MANTALKDLNTELSSVPKAYIHTSIFDLLKCGPGPSSSHTIGPMKAGYDFYEICKENAPFQDKELQFTVKLFGSLSATGLGHGTHAAIIAGLLGHKPEQCPPSLLQKIADNPKQVYSQEFSGSLVKFDLSNIIFDSINHNFPCNNTLIIELINKDKEIIFSKEYYSVGGGFLQWKNYIPTEHGQPTHLYHSMDCLKKIIQETGFTLHEVMLDNETAITGVDRRSIITKLEELIEVMLNSVRRGLEKKGALPGTLNVQRKASTIYGKAKNLPLSHEGFLTSLNAYAMAAAEENADGGVIVTAPTCGASGVLPAILYAMKYDMHIGNRALREGLLAAVSIAFLSKHNAAIAGAEVGCQGEIGVASAMAAAMLSHGRGYTVEISANAAEIALEHHLGLTCDPVGGYVQIPCIERNAVGAIKAYNAFLIAISENPADHKVSLDSTIKAMDETGREMNHKFKETSLGGLAVSMINC